MGKDRKKDIRSKGKLTSSSDAAEKLGGTGTGFIGFPSSRAASFESDQSSSLEPEYQLAFKALSKKDSTTKLKALQELNVLFKGLVDDNVQATLKLWSQSYPKLGMDADRRVREATNQSFIILVRSVKKNLAPYLKSVVGVWICCLYDPAKEVAIAARNALNTAFAPEKQPEMITFCKKEIIDHIKDNFEQMSLLAGSQQQPDQDKYERTIFTTIMCIGHLIENVPTSENEKLLATFQEFIDKKFWGFFKSKSTLIRKACYHLVTLLSLKFPVLLESHLGEIAKIVLGSFNEKEATLHQDMWESILSFMKAFPNSWTLVNHKDIFSRLWAFLRNAGYGSATATYPSLLPFVAQLPTDVMGDLGSFYQEFLSNLWKGLSNENFSKFSTFSLIISYLECLRFFIVQARQVDSKLEQLLLGEVYFDLVKYFLSTENLTSTDDVLKVMADFHAKVFPGCPSEISLSFWNSVESFTMKKVISPEITPAFFYERLAIFCNALHQILDKSIQKELSCLAKQLFMTSLPIAHKPENVLKHLLLATELACEFSLTYLISETESSSIDKFFWDKILPWLKHWLQTEQDATSSLFAFVRVFLSEKEDTPNEWDAILRAVLTAPNSNRNLFDLLNQVCDLKTAQAWYSGQLDAVSAQLVDQISSASSLEAIQDITNLLSLLLSGKKDGPLIKMSSFITVGTSLKDSLQKHLTSEESDYSLSVQRIFAAIDCIKRFSTATVGDSASQDNYKSLKSKLLALLFDCRSSAKFYDRKIVLQDGEIVEQEDIESDKADADFYHAHLIGNSLVVGGYARTIWSELRESIPPNSLIPNVSLFKDEVITKLHEKLYEPLTLDLFYSVRLLGEQAKTILSVIVEQFGGKEQNLITELLIPQVRWKQLRDAIYHALVPAMLDFNEPSLISISMNGNNQDALSQLIRISTFVIDLIESVGISRFMDGSSVSRCWIVTELMHLWVLSENVQVEASYLLERLWRQHKQLISNFFTGTMWPYLIENTTDEFIATLVQDLFTSSTEHGQVYSLVLSYVIPRLTDAKQFNLQHVESTFVAPLKDQIRKSNACLQTWQAFTASVDTSLTDLANENSIGSTVLQSLSGDLSPDAAARLIEASLVCFPRRIPADNVQKYFQPLLTAVETKYLSIYMKHIPLSIAILRLLSTIESFSTLQMASLKGVINFCSDWLKGAQQDSIVYYYLLRVILALFSRLGPQAKELQIEQHWDRFTKLVFSFISEQLVLDAIPSSPHPLQNATYKHFTELLQLAPAVTFKPHIPVIASKSLSHRNFNLQVAAFAILCKLINEGAVTDDPTIQPSEDLEENVGDLGQLPTSLKSILENKQIVTTLSKRPFHEQLGYLLSWAVFLEYFAKQNSQMRSMITTYLRKSRTTSLVLSNLFLFVDERAAYINVSDSCISDILSNQETPNPHTTQVSKAALLDKLSCRLFYETLKTFPILARMWWTDDLDRKTAGLADRFTLKSVSPALLDNEFSAISGYKSDSTDFLVKANRPFREITSVYVKDEVSLTIVMKLPESYPLRSVELESPQRVGVSEAMWRKWLLSMTTLLLTQDSSLLDAILLWKSNLDKHFEGVDVCPICYSLFHASNRSLPNLACKTCRNKFHSACMYKWISVSHKNDCPLCKSPMF